MTEALRQRFFDFGSAFEHAVTQQIMGLLAIVLVATPLLFVLLRQVGVVTDKLNDELWKRYLSWLIIIPAMTLPVLAGAGWTMLAVGLLGACCYREFTKAPGVPRDRRIEVVVYLGIVGLTLAALDNYYSLFTALFALVVCLIAAAAILADRPQGYIQRTAVGMFGYMLFGVSLLHLAFLTNDANYRPLILLLLLVVELNDVFAFCCGKLFGKRRLAPQTSPNKTIGGALGAVICTTLVVYWLGGSLFAGTALAHPLHRVLLGASISIVGQLGDLMLSSVKRDLGVKDMATLLPGHGGLLDRFDSLILAAPVVFYYVNYFAGVIQDQPARVFSSLY